MEFKPPIAYDDIYEAIDLQIMLSGKPKKELASILYPGRQIETAKSLFSRALSPENTDVHLSVEKLMALLDQIGAENIINYLCDRYFFQRPQKRSPEAAALDKDEYIKHLIRQYEAMGMQLKKLARKEG
jgi:hypothetical protein